MDSDSDPPIVIRHPRGVWVTSIVVTVVIGLTAVFMFIATVYLILGRNVGISLVVAAITGVIGVLFCYVLRDTRGKQGWQISVGKTALDLALPRGRSLIHQLEPVRTQLRYDDICAVETRLESYRSFGMANMHRSYALRLKSDQLIVLGEDRALGTSMESSFLAGAIKIIVQKGLLETRDLGMAEGRGGILAVLFTSPPSWDTASISEEQQSVVWNRVRRTGVLALLVPVIVLLAVLFSQII